MAAVVDIVSRHSLSIDMQHRNQLNKSKLALYKVLAHSNSDLKLLYMHSKMEHFRYKGGFMAWCVLLQN